MDDISRVDGFQIVQKLGSGGYGEIFSVENSHTHKLFALKTENIDTKNRAMANEIKILQLLPENSCFPHVIAQGNTLSVNYFVMPLYGPSLSSMRHNIEGEHFSLPTVFRIARETINIIQTLVLIDFGLSAPYTNKDGSLIEIHNSEGFRGTLKYASVNVHKMVEPTRRDDVKSWVYTRKELARGKLPWKDVQDHNLSMSCKQSISPDKLCSGLPRQMKIIYSLVKDLGFDQEPDYESIKLELQRIFIENSWEEDTPYDWETNPEIIRKLTPHPQLFDKNLAQQISKMPKSKKKKCNIQ